MIFCNEAQLRLAQLKELYETPGVSRWLFISATVAFLVTAGPVIGLKVLGFTATGVVKGCFTACGRFFGVGFQGILSLCRSMLRPCFIFCF